MSSGSGGRSSGVNYATSAMYNRMFSGLQNVPNFRQVANALATTYQADTGAGGGSLKRQFKSIPLFGSANGLKIQFSIIGLREYAYQHAPVQSMATSPTRAPLQEIITTQPLVNQYDSDGTHIFYLTYIYYLTYDINDPSKPILNGYGYLTCNFFQESSVRAVFTVTDFTTRILSGALFGIGNGYPGSNIQHSENVYMFNNNSGKTINLVLTINNDIVTIQTPS